MDFFATQERARKRTGWLVAAFLAAILGIVGTLYAAAATFVRTAEIQDQQARRVYPVVDPGWWFPDLFGGILAGVGLIVLAGSGFKLLALRGGGGASVAESMGGVLLPPNTTDFKERRLLNVVEEMALASGVPVPPVYVMRNEQRINAFAAGFRPDQAVIGITQGALDAFSREELQGVIAHEFSHILNGDMRLNMKLIGLLQGILLIYLVGRIALRIGAYSGGNNRKNNALPIVIGLVMIVTGLIGYFVGRLIKMAISRQREYLADASAVQFTRSPFGLADALKRIGANAGGSGVANPKAEEISHMFFANALSGGWGALLATHPPLIDRIRALEPDFDGDFERVRERLDRRDAAFRASEKPSEAAERKSHEWLVKAAMLGTLDAGAAAGSVGAPAQAHLDAARNLLAGLPEALLAQCRDPFGARAVIYRLLLDDREDVRAHQLAALDRQADPKVVAVVRALLDHGVSVPSALRLPVLDLCLPALKQLSDRQRDTFTANLDTLIRADQSVSLSEYILRRVVLHGLGLDGAFGKEGAIGLSDAAVAIVAMLAARGHDQSGEADRAYAAAIDLLRPALGDLPTARPSPSLADFDRALTRFVRADPPVQKQLLAACAACQAADGKLTGEELDLFRCIAAALNLPVPLALAPTDEED